MVSASAVIRSLSKASWHARNGASFHLPPNPQWLYGLPSLSADSSLNSVDSSRQRRTCRITFRLDRPVCSGLCAWLRCGRKCTQKRHVASRRHQHNQEHLNGSDGTN